MTTRRTTSRSASRDPATRELDLDEPTAREKENLAQLAECRKRLIIDRDDLDTALLEQPEMFRIAAEGLVEAVSIRDQMKLELEELTAREDQRLRTEAVEKEEKVTEAGLQNRLKDTPTVQRGQRAYLEAKKTADLWDAIKEAYRERSRVLKALVEKLVSERYDQGLGRGEGQARNNLRTEQSDRIREETGRMRREGYGSGEVKALGTRV